jgi:RimJ/RimL family protein N-acetyltransferase
MELNVQPVTLEGRFVRLEPMLAEHAPGLAEVGLDPELWRWIPTPVVTLADMEGYVAEALADQAKGSALPFTVIERASGRVAGSTRYAAIERRDRRVEIGWTWYARPWQRTAVNTETKRLLLGHAFDVLGCVRVELKTDALNEPSRRAIERLGARQEGILRKHKLVTSTGRFRDTVYYSILAEEWPGVRERLDARLG